jgi:hypothetical protein
MKPPFYILVNDKDLEHIKFYHEFRNQGLNYEGEFGVYSKGIAYTKYGCFHLGPRRMHYIETALKFRNKIAEELNLPLDDLKIVRVEKSLKNTHNRIKNMKLESITFEGVWK